MNKRQAKLLAYRYAWEVVEANILTASFADEDMTDEDAAKVEQALGEIAEALRARYERMKEAQP